MNDDLTLSDAALALITARFRILSEPLRLRLVQLLRRGPMTVTELVRALGTTQPNVSRHLRLMQNEGVVARRTEGTLAWYSIADPSVVSLCDEVCATLGKRLAREGRLASELRRAGGNGES